MCFVVIFTCSHQEGGADHYSFSNGDLVDNLEHGEWTYQYKGTDKVYKAGLYDKGLKIQKWIYNIDDIKHEVKWNIFTDTVKNVALNYSENWEILNHKDKAFLARTSNTDNEYIVILIHDKKHINIDNVEEYLLEIYNVMLKDTVEEITGYTMRNVDFENGVRTYSGEFYTMIEDEEYINYVFYVEQDSVIIDFTQKSKLVTGDFKEIIFNEVVYSLFLNNRKIFRVDDYVKSEKLINLDSLNAFFENIKM